MTLANLARMTTATTGTGTITLGSAVAGFLTFAQAGISSGDTVTYAIEDGSSREIGYGIYTSAGTTLTRNVLNSTNSNNAISLSGSAQVFITASSTDFLNRAQIAMEAQGIKHQVGESGLYGTGTSPGTSVEVGRLLGVRAGETVTGIVIKLISITGLSLTNAYVAAYTTAGVQVGVSGDIKASLTTTGLIALPFTTPWVPTTSQGFYGCFKQTGATLATVARASAAVAENGVGSGVAASVSRTGQTVAPTTPATFTANANGWYMGWY